MSAASASGLIFWRPAFASVSLHIVILAVLTANWVDSEPSVATPKIQPKYIEARLIDAADLRPKPKKKPPVAKPKPAKPKPAKPKVVKPKPTPKPQIKAQPEPKPVVPVKPEQVKAPSTAEQAALARDELVLAMDAEDDLLEQASDQDVAQSYVALIGRTVQDNWSRPPSARNGMEAELVIQLIPTGEVVSVSVLRSSGLPEFDRSAVNAVQKAGRFPELQQVPSRIFERSFRQFRLLFKPEDLRF
jgi:TonB family protein